jgi:hypothetical protein
MMNYMKFLSAGLMVLIAGCASPSMQIEGLKFVNETGIPVKKVELQVVKTFEAASCSYISPGSEFSTQFPLKEYRGNDIKVIWKDRAGSHDFGPTVIALPDPIPEEPVMAVIVLKPAGRATASFRVEQDEEEEE